MPLKKVRTTVKYRELFEAAMVSLSEFVFEQLTRSAREQAVRRVVEACRDCLTIGLRPGASQAWRAPKNKPAAWTPMRRLTARIERLDSTNRDRWRETLQAITAGGTPQARTEEDRI